MTLDKVNNRLFIGHHGNSRYDIYQISEDGLPAERHATGSIGSSLLGRGFNTPPLGDAEMSWPSGGDVDEVNQRLFVPDRAMTGVQGGRIMVYDIRPEYLAALEPDELPKAIAVLGQPDFESIAPGAGAATVGSSGQALVDDERQLLFFTDTANNRVLIWDIDPLTLESGMDAIGVIGQPDLNAVSPGAGPTGLVRPNYLAYDQELKHLYVSDAKKRVMVFDVSAQSLDGAGALAAFAVIGQEDFDSDAPRTSMRKFSGGGPISLDYRYDRLFSGSFTENRVLVFDVSADKLAGASNPDAIAVLGQPDFESTDPAVTQDRLTMTRITVDSERQLAYVPDGYPAGNRINIFDIHPDRMQTVLTPAIDQLGHINPEGETNFLSRSAHDRTSPKYWTQGRDVTVDTLDHRLFMSDNYGHRVMVFKLDRLNRLLDRGASWVLGQADAETSVLLPGRDASTLKLPMAVEYDESHKRLFVADTWNDRVLVYDMRPEVVESGMAATHVLGQKDFVSYEPGSGRDRIYFGVREARGIGPAGGRPAELALDKVNQRLFVADGSNHRVLVYDMHPDRIRNGAPAIAVLGQQDFESNEPGLSASQWRLTGDIAVDEEFQRLFVEVPFQNRVLVYDIAPSRLQNGPDATHVIGQADFVSEAPGLSQSKFRQPDGMSYDAGRHHLYVTDKFHNRILAFDAHPDRLVNLPEAIAVIGELDFDNVRDGPGIYPDFQDRLFDPRGSYFDPVGRRLYQSEGTNGRLTVFTLPRVEYLVDLPARSSLRYASTDALLSTGQEVFSSGYAVASTEEMARVAAVNVHYVTRGLRERVSARQSRELISLAMLPVAEPVRTALIYADGAEGSDVHLVLVNPGDVGAKVEFTLRTGAGELLEASREAEAGGQLSLRVSELFGEAEFQGVLRLAGSQALNIHALLEREDGRGNTLLSPAPMVGGDEAPAVSGQGRRVLPAVPTGAGSKVSIVLLNSGEEDVKGRVEITDQEPIPYTIPAGEAFVHEIPSDARPLLQGMGIVRAESGAAPAAFAVVSSVRRDGALGSVHTVSSHQQGTLFWAPLNTWPDVLHHGEIDADLHVVNDGAVPATVYLDWFDMDGNSAGRFERTIVAGDRDILSMEEVFGQSPMRGALRVFADVEVSVTLLESTRTTRDQMVVADVPLQKTPLEARQRVVFPLFQNGEGHATEMLMINTDRQGHSGVLAIYDEDGQARETILR